MNRTDAPRPQRRGRWRLPALALATTLTLAPALALVSACATDPSADDGAGLDETPTPADPDYAMLPAPQRLLRASMLLRGQRPSYAEYMAVLDDPQAYGGIVDAYLESPEFGATVRQNFTEWMELDQAPDTYPAGFPAVGELAGLETHALNTSIIQAPGRLAEHIVMQDRPWSEIVTADYTLADGVVAVVWGLDYDWGASDGTAWQVTHYADGRPKAGVLSDGWVFTRMPSTDNNRQRERASLVANSLICHDYPGRPVLIPADIDLTAPDAIDNAIENNEVCVGCHQTLDPLASFFAVHYGLRLPEYEVGYPLQQYTPEAAAGYEQPAWYGHPANDLVELGQLIADDPRFRTCAVRRFYSELMHVPVEDVPQAAIARYLPDFVASELDVKVLVRAIVMAPEFGAVAGDETSTASPEHDSLGLRRATPQQLDSLFAALVGYQWRAEVPFDLGGGTVGNVPLMRDYLWGYRTLAGGPNNFDTTTHARTSTPTTLLVLSALAERAARATVEHDYADPGAAHLLVTPGALEGQAEAVREQLQLLHLLLYGEALELDDPTLDDSVSLFQSAAAGGDPQRAWAVTLAALFQDPRILLF